jgi:hypothetical protein
MAPKQNIQTKKVRKDPGSVRTSDIHNLVAAMSKLQYQIRTHVPLKGETRNMIRSTENSPIDSPSRAAQFLDSLAALLVSKPQGEVIATALRIDGRARPSKSLLRGNEVPAATIVHIREIWELLQKISKRSHFPNPRPTDESPEHEKIKYDQFQELLKTLGRRCVRFSFSILQKRVIAVLLSSEALT